MLNQHTAAKLTLKAVINKLFCSVITDKTVLL